MRRLGELTLFDVQRLLTEAIVRSGDETGEPR
jgi:hypothetical protein